MATPKSTGTLPYSTDGEDEDQFEKFNVVLDRIIADAEAKQAAEAAQPAQAAEAVEGNNEQAEEDDDFLCHCDEHCCDDYDFECPCGHEDCIGGHCVCGATTAGSDYEVHGYCSKECCMEVNYRLR